MIILLYTYLTVPIMSLMTIVSSYSLRTYILKCSGHFKSLNSHPLDFLLHFITFKHVKSLFLFLNSNKFATHANILTKKLINQFEIQIAHGQEIYTFNVQTMNMAFNAFTMWKNHHLVFPTKKLCFFRPCSIESSLWSIHHLKTLQTQANCSFHCVKLVLSKWSNFTKSWFNIFKVVPSFTPFILANIV